MPDDRPMPLTGEDYIEDHPTLGSHVDNFPSRRLRALLRGWSVLIGLSILINIALWNVDVWWVGPVVVVFMGPLALVIGWRILHVWNREIIFYERGFTFREGSKHIPFPYVEVKSIRLRAEQISIFGGLFRWNIYQITLRTFPGDEIQIDNVYRRVAQMGDQIMAEVNKHLRPTIKLHIEMGNEVAFADYLYVSKDGIRVDPGVLEQRERDPRLLWHEFGGYRAKNRQLFFLTQDGQDWFGVPLYEIDNLILLIEILKAHQPVITTGTAS